ncbi:NAD(P)-dependent dehydrogenase, short-chain alcohol dehydrogenase family [Pseudonocardia thermophila]|uniref:NAD(P)-dependent dehydrogenase, short-chain alcohol dehydrogenase family n=1 Tax=Pseudonocardia thermophila TaxID=1848 RepID=A0A1M7BBA5_PSETH|nr:SDR family NAD(P)-dependent oxidoreductase [Pseudonocardia thermophila]SHL52262.1 NAD(P)-dependent dehydrogenase, short-chain alcohol dehydrogenase family [Pseudonocardia thermophila]
MSSSTGRLTGKVALVTGAGSGIGAATAELFAREGARVVAADIDPAGAAGTAERIRDDGGIVEPFAADVAQEAAVAELVEFTVRTFGRLDVLQNYASNRSVVAADVAVADCDPQVWAQQLSVDLMGCVLTAKYAVPHMLRAGGGSITNASSLVGWLSLDARPAYATAKAGVIGLSKAIAVEYGKRGIRCNVVAPGPIVSPGTAGMYTPAQTEVLVDHVAAPRLGRPDDVALAALFLASPEAAFINGHVLVIDGGMSAYAPMVPSFRRLVDAAGGQG